MPPDRDLDRELRDLGPHVDYPQVPDLARSVRSRLEAEDGTAGPPSRSRPQLWWIAAAALVLLVAVPVFSLAIRETGGGSFSASGDADGGAAGDRGETEGAAVQQAPTPMAMESGGSAAAVSAEAACGSPEPVLEAWPPRGAPGDAFEVSGRHFVAGFSVCDDTGSGAPSPTQTVPARDVRVVFLQGGKTWELGKIEADKNSRIAAKLKVPADATAGRATVRATYGQGPSEAPHGPTSAEARFVVLD